MECEFPTHNSSSEEIKEIFKETKTIAIIGLSPKSEKDSNKVGVYLQNAGFKIIPVYPKGDEILGEKVYKKLSEIPKSIKIDMVDMFRKPEFASELIKDIKKRDDIKCFWLQLGIVNNEAVKEAKEFGIKVVQNKCTKIEHKILVDNG